MSTATRSPGNPRSRQDAICPVSHPIAASALNAWPDSSRPSHPAAVICPAAIAGPTAIPRRSSSADRPARPGVAEPHHLQPSGQPVPDERGGQVEQLLGLTERQARVIIHRQLRDLRARVRATLPPPPPGTGPAVPTTVPAAMLPRAVPRQAAGLAARHAHPSPRQTPLTRLPYPPEPGHPRIPAKPPPADRTWAVPLSGGPGKRRFRGPRAHRAAVVIESASGRDQCRQACCQVNDDPRARPGAGSREEHRRHPPGDQDDGRSLFRPGIRVFLISQRAAVTGLPNAAFDGINRIRAAESEGPQATHFPPRAGESRLRAGGRASTPLPGPQGTSPHPPGTGPAVRVPQAVPGRTAGRHRDTARCPHPGRRGRGAGRSPLVHISSGLLQCRSGTGHRLWAARPYPGASWRIAL